ncbi:MAG: ferredoxin reductase [Acidimicrobiia bacterium]|nr:ferredoxin reductase [Acidimicrobiia bacterium]
MDRVVIVGASLAGLRAAEALRHHGFGGTVTVIDGQPHLPYDRPPLSKRFLLGELGLDRIQLITETNLEKLDLDLRLGTWGLALDPSAKILKTSSGEIPYDGLILATGAAPRRIPTWPEREGIHVLRTLDDTLALKAEFDKGPARVVVVGGGFIGLEVASTARKLGLEVTVVEPLPAPLVRGLGERMGLVMAELHRQRGVDIRLSTGVEEVIGQPRVEALRLTDGTTVPADVVVVAVGVAPAVQWLENSGLELRDGVVCDATLAAGPGIYAAGDLCRWPTARYGEVRIEHWTNAAEQGERAAQNLLAWSTGGEQHPYDPVPFVWSDQYEAKIQVLGRLSGDDDIEVVAGDPETFKFLALYGRAGQLQGVLAVSMVRALMPYRQLLADHVSWADAKAFAAQQQT